jgi:hypothetical protein
MVERVNQTLVNMLKRSLFDFDRAWDSEVYNVTLAYNTAIHSGTGESPYETLFGTKPRSIIDIMLGQKSRTGREALMPTQVADNTTDESDTIPDRRNSVSQVLENVTGANFTASDLRSKSHLKGYKPGDLVLVRRFVKPKLGKFRLTWEHGPYRVIQREGETTYQLKSVRSRTTKKVHMGDIKLWLPATYMGELRLSEELMKHLEEKWGEMTFVRAGGDWPPGKQLLMIPDFSELYSTFSRIELSPTPAIVIVPDWPECRWFRKYQNKCLDRFDVPNRGGSFTCKNVPMGAMQFPFVAFLMKN